METHRTRVSNPCLLAAALLLLGASLPASAYVYETCRGNNSVWRDSTQPFLATPISFPAGSTVRTSLNASAEGWNQFSPANVFRFALIYINSPSYRLGDGWNSILFTDDYDFDGALAIARIRRAGCIPIFSRKRIKEVDILFNSDYIWSTATNPSQPLNGSPFNMTLVSLHEMGHAFGLKHENDVLGTLDEFYPSGGPLGHSYDVHPHGDEALGARAGYGTAGVERDLAASAYRRTGGGTSRVISTRSTTFRGIPQAFQFTMENRGTERQNYVRVQYYLSADRSISTADRLLGSATFSLNAGTVSTLTANVTVPISVPAGSYYFGYIVDANNAVGEVDEGNNAVAHYQRTFVTAAAPPNQAPTACFTATPRFGSSPLRVTVDASCSSDVDGTVSAYYWDFGDGDFGTGQSASHWYVQSGESVIRLTVIDDDGASSSRVISIFVTCEAGGFCEFPF